jgi:hypothetical protein
MARGAAVLLVIAALAAGGCGGGGHSLGTVPRGTNSQLVTRPRARPVAVRLRGKDSGVARLSRAASGEKTAVAVTLSGGANGSMTVELAHGYCTKPTALTSTTVLGRLRGGKASWTTPTPYAQLTTGPTAVVVRSAQHAVVACGNTPRG